MEDINLSCGRLSELSTFNKAMKDMAKLGYQPIMLSQVSMGPGGYDICILLVKK